MQITSRRKIFIGLIVLAVLVMIVAGKKLFQHEHELNSRIADVMNSVESIEESLKEKPILPVQTENKELIQSVNDTVGKSRNLDVYQKIACGQDIDILVVGDSIATYSWPNDAADWIEGNYGIKCAVRKEVLPSETSFAGYISACKIEDDYHCDLAIVCYGQNDDPEDFPEYYESLLRVLKKKFPECRFVCVIEASQQTYTEKCRNIIELADYYGMQIADAILASDNSGYAFRELSYDGVHPTDLGSEYYAQSVISSVTPEIHNAFKEKESFLMDLINDIESDFGLAAGDILPMPFYDVIDSEKTLFLPAGDFTRTDINTYEMDISGIGGYLAVDRLWYSEDNRTEIYIDGKLICSNTKEYDKNLNLEKIYLLSEDKINLDGRLSVVFPNEAQADGFFGIAIIGK